MSETLILVVAVVATCAFIFGATVVLTPFFERLRERQGIKTTPEIPRRKQYRTVAICCVGGALVALAPALIHSKAIAAGAFGLLFVMLIAGVAVISLRDVRQTKRREGGDLPVSPRRRGSRPPGRRGIRPG